MTKTKVDGCDKYQNKMIYANVPVSATPPTDLSSSKIIKICYVIRVITMTSSYWNGDAIVDVPITIGTHPIRDNVAENMTSIPNIPFVLSGNVVSLQPSELQSVEEDAPPYSSLLTSPPPFPNDELPTYAEALNPNDENILKPIHLMLKHSNEGQL
ncbi:uncharacterized protein LOC129565385 [Sitodiplosis mosellana]|uniref:uncharacterized protein LOC129565385 n=1 Tax=Sitodiplosis mosellana TaxID=263140 RepID=UPI00244374A3|nr:uncharacterized protein LOC129565385 [Sitodiplosis mosellana]